MAENVQSVVRAFALVRALALASEPMALGDLAHQVGLPKSTARRLLATLESIGVVDRGPEPGSYLAGAGLTSLAGTGHGIGSLHALAGPFLRDIVELFAEDATLAIVDGTSVLFTEQVVGPNPIQVPDGTGIRYPLHTVASGYVFMAQWPDDEIAAYCQDLGIDPGPVADKAGVARELGYAWHDGWIEGISAVAVPIQVDSGAVGTIGAFGPSYRFPGERLRADVGESIGQVAARLSQLLG